MSVSNIITAWSTTSSAANLKRQNQLILEAQQREQTVNNLRQLMFEFNTWFEKIEALAANSLKAYAQLRTWIIQFNKSGLSANQFPEMSDKEYFKRLSERAEKLFKKLESELGEKADKINNVMQWDSQIPELDKLVGYSELIEESPEDRNSLDTLLHPKFLLIGGLVILARFLLDLFGTPAGDDIPVLSWIGIALLYVAVFVWRSKMESKRYKENREVFENFNKLKEKLKIKTTSINPRQELVRIRARMLAELNKKGFELQPDFESNRKFRNEVFDNAESTLKELNLSWTDYEALFQ